MGTTKRALEWMLALTLLGGCPLTEDPQAEREPAQMDGDPAQGDGASDDGQDGDPKDGSPSDGQDGIDASMLLPDAGPGDGEPADGTDGTPSDGDGGDGNIGLDAGEPDAGEPDAGEPDAGPPDAGQPIEVPDLGDLTMADQDRANLILGLLAEQDYANTWYPFFEPTTELRTLIVTPSHGAKVRVFANPVANAAAKKWVRDGYPMPLVFPDGSIIAKQVYSVSDTGEATLTTTVVMAKLSGLDDALYEGDWFYARITAANVASRSTTCVNCHNGRKQTALWPPNPEIPTDVGGRDSAIVPYDYLYAPFCFGPDSPECAGAHQ